MDTLNQSARVPEVINWVLDLVERVEALEAQVALLEDNAEETTPSEAPVAVPVAPYTEQFTDVLPQDIKTKYSISVQGTHLRDNETGERYLIGSPDMPELATAYVEQRKREGLL